MRAGLISTGIPTAATSQASCWSPFSAISTASSWRRATSQLRFDAHGGHFAVWAYDTHKLPISPLHYTHILGDAHPELERLGDAFAALPDWRSAGRRGRAI